MKPTMSSAELRRSGDTLVDDAADGADRLREAASIEVGRLAADVEELIKQLGSVADAEVARLRDKVQRTLTATRDSLKERSGRVRAGGRRVATATDSYVRERPWAALGIAAAAGALIGALSTRRH